MSIRKEQIMNSAGGLAANLFEKFDKLRKQQQQQQTATSDTSNNNLITNLAISFHKNLSNQNSSNNSPIANTPNNPNLLIIDDDDLDDTNIEIETFQLKQPLTKSKSINTATSSNSLNTKITQSQSDFDLNNNSITVNALNPLGNKMTTSTSLFKMSSGFLDDLMLKKADLVNKTNSVVDEAEDVLRRRFFQKKKSIDSISTPPTQTPQTEQAAEVIEIKPQIIQPTESVEDKDSQQIKEIVEPKIDEIQIRSDVVVKEDKKETKTNYFKYALIIPIICSVLICLLLKLSNRSSSLISVIIFYFCGFLTGALFVSIVIFFILIKFNLIKTTTQPENKPIDTASNDQLHSLLIQTAINKEIKNFDGVYKSWMNELREPYDPDTYFLNKTRSVYVNLDGTILRLQATTSKIPKRAVHSEKIGNMQFSEQRIYDLTDCECSILPSELVRKRYWSKKYPLCLKNVKLQSSKCNHSLIRRKSSLSPPPVSTPTASQSEECLNDEQVVQQLDNTTLILFARTDREKEEWFKLFKKSSAKNLLDSATFMSQKKAKTTQSKPNNKLLISNQNDIITASSFSTGAMSYDTTNDKLIYKLVNEADKAIAPETDNETNNELGTQTENGLLYDTSLNFMNTFLIRMFNDFFTHQFWVQKIRTKIQNKLNKIKMPYFMEELKIIDLDLGFMVPLIKQTSEPWYDDKGLWCHLDIDYSGGVQILISTKLNLMKFKSPNSEEASLINDEKSMNDLDKSKKRLHLAIINSDEEDSAESSGDEYVHTGSNNDDENNKIIESSNKGKKIMNIVNKIASSNYFQKATEIKYIKKAMENVSNCQLLLNVEVKKIVGTIALNIPPHPSDRIWYGFVSAPQMVLVATPQVGDKEVSYSAISDWIADKLKSEFQKVLVFPNMDDFYIPILNSELDNKNW